MKKLPPTQIVGTGFPGVARPIHMIDAEFGLSDYISGAKAKRVKATLTTIQAATSRAQAAAALKDYLAERTFLGLTTLKRLMVTHSVPEVRVAILRVLENLKVIMASSEVEDELLESNPSLSPTVFLPLQ